MPLDHELTFNRVRVRCSICRKVLGDVASTDGGRTIETFAAWASESEPKRSRPHVAQHRYESDPLAAPTVTWKHECRDAHGRRRQIQISRRLDKLALPFGNAVRSGADIFVNP